MNVYFTQEISPTSVSQLFDLYSHKIEKNDVCAFKISFGEKGNKGYIKPYLFSPVIQKLKEKGITNIFVADTNVIYRSTRGNTISHLEIAREHGFTYENLGCEVIIADGLFGGGGHDVVVNLKHFKTVKIADAFFYSDIIISFAHFTGHPMCGFGGAIKNIGMGCSTKEGKYKIHHMVSPKYAPQKCKKCGKCIRFCPGGAIVLNDKINLISDKCLGCGECVAICPNDVFKLTWDEKTINSLEKLVEYTFGALKGKKAIFFNFLSYITKICDCFETKEKPMISDIGILVSDDPVSVDQASIDLVNKKYGSDLIKHIYPNIDYTWQIHYAEKIKLGSKNYQLIQI